MYKKLTTLLLTALLILALPLSTMAEGDTLMINRLAFLKEVLQITQVELLQGAVSTFSDITSPEDIAYTETAFKNGIMSGIDGLFKPENPITKEQAVIVMVRALGSQGKVNKLTTETIQNTLSFTDSNSISSWAKPYVAFALSQGIIVKTSDVFNPQAQLSQYEAASMLENLKALYASSYTREGLNAFQMLDSASSKINSFSTYKYGGIMDMEVNASVPEQGNHNVKMSMKIEGAFEKPQKSYAKTTINMVGAEAVPEQSTEVYTDGQNMFLRMPDSDKWTQMDIQPLLKQLQSLTGNMDMTNVGLSQQQMELFGMYATYDPDTIVDEKNYYVIDITVDKNAFKKMLTEMMKTTFDLMPMEQSSDTAPVPSKEEMTQVIHTLLDSMNIEVTYKYFVDPETKLFKDMQIFETITMNQGPIHNVTTAQGTFQYYDFDGPVVFPVITPEDIVTK
ncbi:S-layer homology domain-containing protein [Anaerosolibacter sp.]|uniref:S-layer homology domain-containing protein n=1 Tax=Anaerosolibacter sp. TaxID=1872527 RepID=UPI0039F03AED